MNRSEYELAVALTRNSTMSLTYIDETYGSQMTRLVTRLRSRPEWERLRPTPEFVEKVWNQMREEHNRHTREWRKRKKTQTRLS